MVWTSFEVSLFISGMYLHFPELDWTSAFNRVVSLAHFRRVLSVSLKSAYVRTCVRAYVRNRGEAISGPATQNHTRFIFGLFIFVSNEKKRSKFNHVTQFQFYSVLLLFVSQHFIFSCRVICYLIFVCDRFVGTLWCISLLNYNNKYFKYIRLKISSNF